MGKSVPIWRIYVWIFRVMAWEFDGYLKEPVLTGIPSAGRAGRHRRSRGLAIPCPVAFQQSPTPFHRAPASIPSPRANSRALCSGFGH